MQYSFDIDIAQKYGVNEAIMVHNFVYWITHNRANNEHNHDNRTWTFNTVDAFSELFSFWSPRQIRHILDKLLTKEVLIKGNYNCKKYDQTCWYAFKNEEEFLPAQAQPQLPNLSLPIDNSVTSNRQICQTYTIYKTTDSKQQIRDTPTKIVKEKIKRKKVVCSKFVPKDTHYQLANREGWRSPDLEVAQFIDWHLSHGKKYVDWDRAFNNWLRLAAKFSKEQNIEKGKRKKTTSDIFWDDINPDNIPDFGQQES